MRTVLSLVILFIILSFSVSGCISQPTDPGTQPSNVNTPGMSPTTSISITTTSTPLVTKAPVPTPPMRGPTPVIDVDRIPDASYAFGVSIKINLSFTNRASTTLTRSMFPPKISIQRPGDAPIREVFRSFPGGNQPLQLSPNEVTTYTIVWNQKDDKGQQVRPGWYDVGITWMDDPSAVDGRVHGYPAFVLILPPEGVMEKTIDVYKSQTVNGITFTIERVELLSTGMRVFALNTPPQYALPQGPMLAPPQFMIHGEAEYSFDSSAFTKTMPSAIRFLDNGMEHIWGERLDPAPKNTKDLTFRVTKLGDWQGPWEFPVSLQ